MKAISLYSKFAGRCLTKNDLKQLMDQTPMENIEQALQALEEMELMKKEFAIRDSRWAIFRKCNRCGAGASYLKASACASCGNKVCSYCTRCLFYGKVRSCSSLYSFLPVAESGTDVIMEAPLPLATAQQHAVEKLKSLFDSGAKQIDMVLIPGSGELLILSEYLSYLLHKKKRIFWCQGKKKIAKTVNQLGLLKPKLIRFIEDSKTPIVMGTKWDLLTYYQEFDVIIWDDIFPETFHAWERSMKENGQQLVIRSTAKGNRSPDIVHPVRLHRYPIPIPKFIQYRSLYQHFKRKKPILPFYLFVQEVQALNGQAYILVPTKDQIELTMVWIKEMMPEIANKTCSMSEEDEDAEELRILFSEQKFTFLLIPQQLAERIRIANLHLCLLHADHPTVTQKRLVELTHLIGLNAYFPECEAWFIGETKTESIVQTKKEHIYLNELAKKEGYLQKEA